MVKKLLPVLIALLGIIGGAGAGYVLRPAPGGQEGTAGAPDAPAAEGHGEAPAEGHAEAAPPAEGEAAHGEAAPAEHAAPAGEEAAPAEGEGEGSGLPDYVKLSNQFVVPVVEDGRVAAMVILSLTLEVPSGMSESVYAREPKLRDAFLQVLFDHANAGGFRGTFTDGANLVILRSALLEVAQKIMAGSVSDVLIADIVRQDN